MISDICTQKIKDENKVISCIRPSFADNLCILHHKHSEKDQDKFRNELKRTLEDKTSRIIDLREVTFPGGYIIFKDREIKKPIIFDDSIFLGRPAHFERTTFQKHCSFRNVIFHSELVFDNCHFNEIVNFDYAKIERIGAHFKTCTFEKEAVFYGTNFNASTQFTNDSVFKGTASFESAIVASRLSIKDSTFVKELSFNECTVSKTIDFVNVKLDGTNYFKVKTLDGGTFSFRGTEFQGNTYFSERHFNSNPPNFMKCVMSGVRMLELPILLKEKNYSIVNIDNCQWPKKRYWGMHLLSGRDVLADEFDLRQTLGLPDRYYQVKDKLYKFFGKKIDSIEEEASKSHKLLKAYESLHKRYFDNSEYDQAREFYVSSMVQKRKLERFFSISRLTSFMYSILSRYGESMLRPFIAMIFIWFMFPVFLLQEGYVLENRFGQSESDTVLIEKPFIEVLPDGSSEWIFVTDEYWYTLKLSFSLSTFTRGGAPRPPLASNANMILNLETFLNLLFFGFLVLGIRRRFAPKKPIR